jgi:hypothetical protein
MIGLDSLPQEIVFKIVQWTNSIVEEDQRRAAIQAHAHEHGDFGPNMPAGLQDMVNMDIGLPPMLQMFGQFVTNGPGAPGPGPGAQQNNPNNGPNNANNANNANANGANPNPNAAGQPVNPMLGIANFLQGLAGGPPAQQPQANHDAHEDTDDEMPGELRRAVDEELFSRMSDRRVVFPGLESINTTEPAEIPVTPQATQPQTPAPTVSVAVDSDEEGDMPSLEPMGGLNGSAVLDIVDNTSVLPTPNGASQTDDGNSDLPDLEPVYPSNAEEESATAAPTVVTISDLHTLDTTTTADGSEVVPEVMLPPALATLLGEGMDEDVRDPLLRSV